MTINLLGAAAEGLYLTDCLGTLPVESALYPSLDARAAARNFSRADFPLICSCMRRQSGIMVTWSSWDLSALLLAHCPSENRLSVCQDPRHANENGKCCDG